jgi:hypothetical protein
MSQANGVVDCWACCGKPFLVSALGFVNRMRRSECQKSWRTRVEARAAGVRFEPTISRPEPRRSTPDQPTTDAKMTLRDRIAMVILLVPTIGLLGQGLLYVTTSEFMPYHSAALEADWQELPSNYQGFVLGVIKGMGAGSIGASVAILIMMFIPLRRGVFWARWAVPLVGVIFTALTAYAAITIDRRTPAETPWLATLGLTVVYIVGGAILLTNRTRLANS